MFENNDNMKNYASLEVNNYLNHIQIELRKCNLPEKEITTILEEFRNHVSGRLGEMFLQKSQIRKEDINQILAELGKPENIASDYLQISTGEISKAMYNKTKLGYEKQIDNSEKTKKAVYIFIRLMLAIILSFTVMVYSLILFSSEIINSGLEYILTSQYIESFSIILAIYSLFLLNESMIKQKENKKIKIFIKLSYLMNCAIVGVFIALMSTYYIYNHIYYIDYFITFFIVIIPFLMSILVLKKPYGSLTFN